MAPWPDRDVTFLVIQNYLQRLQITKDNAVDIFNRFADPTDPLFAGVLNKHEKTYQRKCRAIQEDIDAFFALGRATAGTAQGVGASTAQGGSAITGNGGSATGGAPETAEVERLRREVQRLSALNVRLEDSWDRLEGQQEVMRAVMEGLREENALLKQQAMRTESSKEGLHDAMVAVRYENRELSAKSFGMKEVVREAEVEKREFGVRRQEVETKMARAERTLSTMAGNNVTLNSRNRALSTRLQLSNGKNKQYQARIAKLEGQVVEGDLVEAQKRAELAEAAFWGQKTQLREKYNEVEVYRAELAKIQEMMTKSVADRERVLGSE
ncbi:hypothetical protein HDV00_004706 [Rhizophlyctis rosea]|nr:hypothetical protein HDV00_004706 [Rhizophlyctis rosea]